ncbi:PfkB family carbohydrate kinase [Streptomyces pactum]
MPASLSTDVVCLGESMVAFVPTRPGPLAEVPAFTRSAGGAESNVACALARLGHRVRWISRLGTDGFGDHVLAAVAEAGVDVHGVRRDPDRPTGIYFRTAGERSWGGPDPAPDGAPPGEVVYYRAGSAASAMSPRTVARADAYGGRLLHLTGITPALSDGCRELVRELTARRPGRPWVSFDVNYRAALWRSPGPTDPEVLLELARGCDLVFVGEDEASAAWGLRGPDAVRSALPEPGVLVVKRGAAGAVAYVRPGAEAWPATAVPAPGGPADDSPARGGPEYGGPGSGPSGAAAPGPGGATGAGPGPSGTPGTRPGTAPGGGPEPSGAPGPGPSGAAGRGEGGPATAAPDARYAEPAPAVDVVAHVGAGDAFAAGFLSATLRGLPVAHRLRHGHLLAAAALTDPGDLAAPPGRALADRLVALAPDAWGRLRLGPGWTRAEPGTGTDPEAGSVTTEVPAP